MGRNGKTRRPNHAKPSSAYMDSYAYHDDTSRASSAMMSRASSAPSASISGMSGMSYPHDPHSIYTHDSHSIGSDMSSMLAPQRRCPLCPMMRCESSAHSTQGSYMEVKREMEQLVNSKDQLHRAEISLESEKTRGRCLLVTCIMLFIFCTVIFMDQMPKSWKTSMINYLGKDEQAVETKINVADHPNIAINSSPSSWNATAEGSHSTSAPTVAPVEQTQHEPQYLKSEGTDQLLIQVLDKRVGELSFFNRWNIPFLPYRETPVYWHIPRTAGIVVDEIFGRCYGLVQAADSPALIIGHETDAVLEVIENDRGKYFNVNMGTPAGIQRANDLKLTSESRPYIIRTPYIFETSGLFHPGRYGKCFTVLRDPVERAMDVFHHLKEMKKPVFVNMTLSEYAQSPYCEQNWMVRFLSGEMDGAVRQEHLDMAQHVLGRKFIVGFTDRLDESIHRFAKFFQWDKDVSVLKVRDCLANSLGNDAKPAAFSWRVPISKDKKYGEGTEIWKMLAQKNSLDVALYNYARKLYSSQALYVARL